VEDASENMSALSRATPWNSRVGHHETRRLENGCNIPQVWIVSEADQLAVVAALEQPLKTPAPQCLPERPSLKQ
jgi:hypothetical protein